MIKKIHIQNFKSIIDLTFEINDNIYVLAGQNEAGKSSILEAIQAYEDGISNLENLNFEEQDKNNYLQKICITYIFDDYIIDEVLVEIQDLLESDKRDKDKPVLDKFKLQKLKEISITRIFDLEKNKDDDDFQKIEIDKHSLAIIKNSIILDEKKIQDVGHKIIIKKIPSININDEENINDIAHCFWRCTPKLTLFNDFNDILPDSILISDIENKNTNAKGYNAVKKIESLLNQDFVKLSKKTNAQKKSSVDSESKFISATLQEDWKQKINNESEIKIVFDIQNNNEGLPIVYFYIETKEGVLLEPRKRSKGMIWFLSLWIELKSNENKPKMILLFDEPGLHLHVKANNDMLNVFKRLKEKEHQIVYSTHLPSLIETDKLHNIGLVLNTVEKGTIVEGLTTSKLDTTNKKDALQPISEAMGLLPLREFNVLFEKNVIVEGLSDFWYFKSMEKLLNIKSNYQFIPSIGIKSTKVFPLISFCIGYGLEWILIMENGENPINTKNEIKNVLFDNNETLVNEKVHILNFKEIEDMFTLNDFKLVDKNFNIKSDKNASTIIGNRKVIFAKEFFNKVENKEITANKIDSKTLQNFKDVFDLINKSFK